MGVVWIKIYKAMLTNPFNGVKIEMNFSFYSLGVNNSLFLQGIGERNLRLCTL